MNDDEQARNLDKISAIAREAARQVIDEAAFRSCIDTDSTEWLAEAKQALQRVRALADEWALIQDLSTPDFYAENMRESAKELRKALGINRPEDA